MQYDEKAAEFERLKQAQIRIGTMDLKIAAIAAADQDVSLASGLALAHWAKADVHLYAATSHVGPLYGRRAAEIAQVARRWASTMGKR